MNEETYREKLTDLQLEVEELRAKLKASQTGDLISRAAALDALMGAFCDTIIESICKDTIEALPSAQPEIIRCKDCKHQEIHEYNYGGRTYHSYGCELSERYSHVCLDDDFCSRAERREE